MLIGIDHGYTYTKSSKGIIFPSRVRTGEDLDINETITVEINGVSYVVGEQESNYSIDTNKVNDEKTKICILTSIALSSKQKFGEVDIITGLPPGHYKNQKKSLKQMLLDESIFKMKVNGENKIIKINKADVFLQGAGPIFMSPNKYKNSKVLVIDIGGLTVDVCYFEKMKLIKYRTYEKGMLKLYSKMVSDVNSKFDLNHSVLDGERILKEGVKIYGQQQNADFLNEVTSAHIDSFITDIKLDFPIKTMDHVLLIGGGGKGLYQNIKDYIPNIELLPDSQYINALAYEQIGKVRFNA
ncbi:ParM/StbA family protein [Tepidibacter hydrothermalis]|uniref:ParM/StbA family protein n=1 Tax=Tepidibacter hydrothermalis TaxID=3036126 RepID=A0ABY8EGF5_9FIRM|nr:ParM/StbA family protein [Tepidibacter hydrothermalis]WFD12024.1 ParM/StbA family protein [Tepidibacter hydrothermalis]